MTSPSSQPIPSSDPLHSAVLVSQKVMSLTNASQECPVFGSFCGLSELGRQVPLLWDGSVQSPQLLDKEHTILLELSQILTPPTHTLIQSPPPQKPSTPPANKDSARSSTKLSRVSLAGLWASTRKTYCVHSHPLWSFTNYIFLPLGMSIDTQHTKQIHRLMNKLIFESNKKNTPLFIEKQWPVG